MGGVLQTIFSLAWAWVRHALSNPLLAGLTLEQGWRLVPEMLSLDGHAVRRPSVIAPYVGLH